MSAVAGRNGQIKIELPSTDLSDPTTISSAAGLDTAVASAILANVRSWTLEETVDTLDVTVMDATASGFIFRDVLPSFKSWTLSVDFLYDRADSDVSFDDQFISGNTVNVAVYPEGDASGKEFFGGTAMITSISKTASYDGLIEVSVTLEGRAKLWRDDSI